MTFATRHMREDVTHWPVIGSDGFGGFSFGPPVLLKGRWEEKAALFRTNDNEEMVSSSVVYLSEGVEAGDYLGYGDSTSTASPTTLTSAHRVLQRFRTSDLRALTMLWKVFL